MEETLSKGLISERNQKRREMLAGYFFDLSKLMCGGVVIGGLSPLFTGDEMSVYNYLCIGFGSLATILFAYFGNEILKVKLKKIEIMEMLTIIFALASAIGAGLVIWSKTKAGRKWLESL